jgi:hypothetical protein
MAEGRTARPVSGEIMTGASAEAALAWPVHDAADVVDADYELVSPPRRASTEPQTGHAAFAPAAPLVDGMEMLWRDREKAPSSWMTTRGGPVFWVFGLGLAAAAFWVSGGHALVRQTSFLNAAQAAPGFTISGVSSRIDTIGSRPVLLVDGAASNSGNMAAPLPPLEIHVTGADGQVARYKLGTADKPLAPGGRFAFSSRLEVPKNGVKTVTVAFGE